MKDYKQILTAYCQENRLVLTHERLTVLDLILKMGTDNFVLWDLVVKAENQRIARRTVYNCVNLYTKAGILSEPVKKYELRQTA